MKVGKITAKLRDAVHVSFMVGEDEMAWYKNIEIPDALKGLEMKDFHFHVRSDGKIEFILQFDPGILPKQFPPKRERKRRIEKADTRDDSKPSALKVPLTERPVTASIAKGKEAMPGNPKAGK